MSRTGFTLLLFLIPFGLLAQVFIPDPDWRFENFNSQNHFISREIGNLAVDNAGYVWACSNGLYKFDGYRTTDFNKLDKNNGGLRANYPGILIDNNGKIWATSAGLCHYDNVTGKFIYLQPDSKHKISSVSVFTFQHNYLWFVSEYGLGKLDLHSQKISFTSITAVTDPLCISVIDENTLFISSREKVYIYDIKKNSYSTRTLIYKHLLVKVFAVTKNDSSIFFGTNYGVFRVKNIRDMSLENEGPADVSVNDMLFLPADHQKKYLFVGTDGKGLMVYNTFLRKVEFIYTHDSNNPYSLADNIVSRIVTDKKGRLWMATDLGISMLDLSNQQLKVRFLNEDNSDVLGINKIAPDRYDSSKIWMSSYNRGMICVNWPAKKVEKIYGADPGMQKLYDFVQISKTRWLLVTQKKILEWNPEAGILSSKKLPLPDSLALVCNIRGVIMADSNTCFITTNKGLFKYGLLTHRVEIAALCTSKKTEETLKYILLRGFFDKGILWIASRNGLFCYDVTKKRTTIYTDANNKGDYFLFDVAKGSDDRIICASGNGILIFNKRSKTFKLITTVAGIAKPSCTNVIDINDTVLAGTAEGIVYYDLKTNASARAEHEPSMILLFPSSPFTVIKHDVIFGFRNGYAWLTPERKISLVPSDPVIENVYVNNQTAAHLEDGTIGKLTLAHSDNSINIAFTSFLYTDPDHIKFRCRLNGADSRWQYTEEQRSANYAQLPPGDYTFYVQCGNKNGVWNSHLASFRFVIHPPYWETWWFRSAVVLLIALALYQLYRYRIKNIYAIQRIRERIASDFHDDIGAALSSISIFSEVADTQLEEKLPHEQTREIIGHISLHSRAMLDAMDDIIWAVNPQNDHFNDLAVRMCEFAIPLLEAKNIQFDINIPQDILNTRIKMEARKNIFLIFKECINNILKHSACTAMKVVINRLNNQLEMVISDNGKGFDADAPSTRNGIRNIYKRAIEINGTIKVSSQPGAGTVTRLLINIV